VIDVKVTLRGGLFGKDIPRIVQKQLVREVIVKVDERMGRKGPQGSGGSGIGVKRNTVSRQPDGLQLTVSSTLNRPRVKGTAWQRKNIGIIKAMAPRVVRKAAERIAEEMGGG